jgi:ribosome biogenesis GTPase
VLETIGYDAATAASFAPWDAADASVGRVARVDRGVLTVLTEGGAARVTLGGPLLRRMAQDPAESPCAGDWVVVRRWPDKRETVEQVLPRRTAVVQDPERGARPVEVLAANVDLAAVVVDLAVAAPGAGKVRRLLALATTSGATPLVVLTAGSHRRADEPAEERAEERAAQLTAMSYDAAPGCEVVHVDDTGAGLERLRELVAGRRTLALLGSGAATSSLARALVGAEVIAARRTGRVLAVLPGGGAVLDLGRPAAPSRPSSPSLGGWNTQQGAQ